MTLGQDLKDGGKEEGTVLGRGSHCREGLGQNLQTGTIGLWVLEEARLEGKEQGRRGVW
jgi:hypothetical protein